MTTDNIAALSDELLIEELLVGLALDLDVRPLSAEVLRRDIVEQARARAREKTATERWRMGEA